MSTEPITKEFIKSLSADQLKAEMRNPERLAEINAFLSTPEAASLADEVVAEIPVVDPPVLTPEEQAADAAAAADAAQRTPSRSSSLFGQSSGTFGGVGAAERAVAPQFKVPDNASPAEILEAWKQAQLAAGVNPDEAFKQAFPGRK